MNKDFTFDLQCFADGTTAEGGGETTAGTSATTETNDGNTDNGNKPADTNKPATDNTADIQKLINAEVAKAQKQWEADFVKKQEAAQKEAERLSKLSEAERAKAEKENLQKELDALKAEVKAKELREETVKDLAKRKLPVEFADYFITDDSESTLKRITDFEKAFKTAVENAVNEKLKGKPPESGGTSIDGTVQNAKNGFLDTIRKHQAKR